MSNRSAGDPSNFAPRLYLATPMVEDPKPFIPALTAALQAADVAAVLLRLAPADERTLINRIKAIAPLVQDANAALVIDGHAGIVARAGADGAHLTGVEAFAAALAQLKPDRIAGCGSVHTRHDAMLAAEQGADYVMFGEPEDGARPPMETIIERITWWAEVFQVPCVAYAATLDEVGLLASAGADFIVAADFVWTDARGPAAAIADAAERLTRAAAAA